MNLWKNTRSVTGLGLIASALILAGCGAIDPETGEERLRANPYNSQMAKKIHVDRLTPVLVVNFKPTDGDLSDVEKGRILGFMDAQKAPYGSEMQVELPEFDDPERVNEARYGAVGAFLEDLGFVVTPKVVKDGLQNSLRVYHIKYVATVDQSCDGNWTEPDGNRFENLPLPHMGCATASALARMVVKPKDLVEPEDIHGTDGERAALSISNYRKRGTTSSGSSGGDN